MQREVKSTIVTWCGCQSMVIGAIGAFVCEVDGANMGLHRVVELEVSKHGGGRVGRVVQGWMSASGQDGCWCSLERVGAAHWLCISAVLGSYSMSSEKGMSTCYGVE